LLESFERDDWAVPDTEGTGVGKADQICELAFVRGCDSTVLYSELLRATVPISSGAQSVHGISDLDVKSCPTFAEDQDKISSALAGINELWWYNADYDLRVKKQTSFAQGIPDPEWPKSIDIMPSVGEWCGSWNAGKRGWRWPKLEGGHRAQGDCEHLINCLRRMSQSNTEHAMNIYTETETKSSELEAQGEA
jgi:hypothetical protein